MHNMIYTNTEAVFTANHLRPQNNKPDGKKT